MRFRKKSKKIGNEKNVRKAHIVSKYVLSSPKVKGFAQAFFLERLAGVKGAAPPCRPPQRATAVRLRTKQVRRKRTNKQIL